MIVRLNQERYIFHFELKQFSMKLLFQFRGVCFGVIDLMEETLL